MNIIKYFITHCTSLPLNWLLEWPVLDQVPVGTESLIMSSTTCMRHSTTRMIVNQFILVSAMS